MGVGDLLITTFVTIYRNVRLDSKCSNQAPMPMSRILGYNNKIINTEPSPIIKVQIHSLLFCYYSIIMTYLF